MLIGPTCPHSRRWEFEGEVTKTTVSFHHLNTMLQHPTLLTQFLVGLGARALGLGHGGVPAVVTLRYLPHMNIHGHSLGFVQGH
jgi:hypothetical protein